MIQEKHQFGLMKQETTSTITILDLYMYKLIFSLLIEILNTGFNTLINVKKWRGSASSIWFLSRYM